MINSIKAVLFDVDGTLFSHELNAVPDSTKRSLRALHRNDIKTVVVTGRAMQEYEKLPVSELVFDGYLTLNGQQGGGKAAGIQKFIEEQGLKQEETMAFGDGENDISMLEFAGIGVAMGNAADEVKAIADYVTDSVDEDGIEKALIHFGLI